MINQFLKANRKIKVVVGMSGGIDSAVTAYLLKLRGYKVIGLHMINWDIQEEEDEKRRTNLIPSGTRSTTTTTTPTTTTTTLDCFHKEYEDVQSVCNELSIPCHQVNFVKDYWNDVFLPTLQGYEEGTTPNPDVLCNRHIKFDLFLQHAKKTFQADYVATGHYARVGSCSSNKPRLLSGIDTDKDQSYFLSKINRDCLSSIMFPLGLLTKKQVRNIASISKLKSLAHINQKKESMGMCFIGKRNFNVFLQSYIEMKQGSFINVDTGRAPEITPRNGTNITQKYHKGFARYTVGQGASIDLGSEKWYVVRKKVKNYEVHVCNHFNHPSLFKQSTKCQDVSWLDMKTMNTLKNNKTFNCQCRIRYRSDLVNCVVSMVNERASSGNSSSGSSSSRDCRGNDGDDNETIHTVDRILVEFEDKQRAVAPGQSLVLYDGDVCLGSGTIIDDEEGGGEGGEGLQGSTIDGI